MNKQRPKKQHFVPQLHLNHFVGTDPQGMVWTYDVQTQRVSPSLPKETAVESNFYSVQNEKGEYLDVIEEWLAVVENKAAEPYEKLIRGEIPEGQQRADLAVFVSSMYSRTHAMRRVFGEIHGKGMQLVMDTLASDPEMFEQNLLKYEAAKGPIDPQVRGTLREFILDKSKYTIAVDQSAMIPAIELSDKLVGLFFNMSWCILDSGDHYFISSDTPVTRYVPTKFRYGIFGDGGFINRKVTVTFPLSPNRCLMMGWEKDVSAAIIKLPREDTRSCNRERAYFAERFLFADRQSDGIKRLGQKYKEFGTKMNMGSPGQFAEVKVKRRID